VCTVNDVWAWSRRGVRVASVLRYVDSSHASHSADVSVLGSAAVQPAALLQTSV
jgi:hypothetical protein